MFFFLNIYFLKEEKYFSMIFLRDENCKMLKQLPYLLLDGGDKILLNLPIQRLADSGSLCMPYAAFYFTL